MVTLKKILTRTCVVIFWTATIFAFLYTSELSRFFEEKKSINICIWSGVIDPKIIDQFEKESGIKVNMSYFDGNEELLVKLLATRGEGYDMVAPSDYVCEFLIKHNLLLKLDTSQLNFWGNINPHFLGHYFDPKNEYTVPSEWYVLGLGIRKDYCKNNELPVPSWSLIFDPACMFGRIGLINDSRELAGLAMKYLYKEIREVTPQEVAELRNLLVAQKKHVEAYTDFRGDFLLESGNCSLVVVSNSFIWRTLEKCDHIAFLMPQEGPILNMENYVIPAVSRKADLVYQFLNFLFRLDIQEYNFNEKALLSTRKDAHFLFENEWLKQSTIFVHPDNPQRLELFRNVLTDDQIDEIWLSVKGLL